MSIDKKITKIDMFFRHRVGVDSGRVLERFLEGFSKQKCMKNVKPGFQRKP